MLRIIQNSSPASAQQYYSSADYYTNEQELVGRWGGIAADKLGLSGDVKQEEFKALTENLHPQTGEQLTLRNSSNRTVGYDFNFHAPKSVSLVQALTKDEEILTAFRDAVSETMQELEQEAKTRVRKGKQNSERVTGNLAWAEFVHFTARPVDGLPDPHLHAHCFTFNTTFDKKENAWKAVQFRDLKRDARYYEAAFHARFAKSLSDLGYPIERTRSGWEIGGIDASTLKKFSRRTELIEELANERGITDAERKSELGARTRDKKAKHLTKEELRHSWSSRLNPNEFSAVNSSKEFQTQSKEVSSGVSMQHAIEHRFERQSVVPKKSLLETALRHGVGTVNVHEVHQELKAQNVIVRSREGQELATTREVLAEEKEMLSFAQKGRATRLPLNHEWKIQRTWLNSGQQAAVQHVLNSQDRVILVKGKAGTGKTSLMKETVEAIEADGKKVLTLAPSAEASRGVLRTEGFKNAETMARFLLDEKLQSSIQDGVLWIDEAGLLSTKDLAGTFKLASENNFRVVLSGDWQQHGSVARGSALRLLVRDSGLKAAEVQDIQRQTGDYKKAVNLMSNGRTLDGFDELDRLGWVKEIPDDQRESQIAKDFADTLAQKKTALVVAPTHVEADRVTKAVRHELKGRGLLAIDEQSLQRLVPLHLTTAEKRDSLQFEQGDVIQFVQNVKGHQKGERVVYEPGMSKELEGLPERFAVYRAEPLPVSIGESIRITANGKTQDGLHRLNNGAIYQLKGFTKDGHLKLNNGWVVDKEFGHLAHGYVSTSYSSQGKTVDHVLLASSTMSRPASSQEQHYVSVSRGRSKATVFTDSKSDLRNAIQKSEQQLTATELVGVRQTRMQRWSQFLRRLGSYRRSILSQEQQSPRLQKQEVQIGH